MWRDIVVRLLNRLEGFSWLGIIILHLKWKRLFSIFHIMFPPGLFVGHQVFVCSPDPVKRVVGEECRWMYSTVCSQSSVFPTDQTWERNKTVTGVGFLTLSELTPQWTSQTGLATCISVCWKCFHDLLSILENYYVFQELCATLFYYNRIV